MIYKGAHVSGVIASPLTAEAKIIAFLFEPRSPLYTDSYGGQRCFNVRVCTRYYSPHDS